MANMKAAARKAAHQKVLEQIGRRGTVGTVLMLNRKTIIERADRRSRTRADQIKRAIAEHF